MPRIRQQLRDNLVALISLLVALSTLVYTAWRHEVTEDNRTQREAAFAMLRAAENLQSVVDFSHYDGDLETGNPIKGWGTVLYLRDLGVMLPCDVQARADEVRLAWERDWEALGTDEAAAQRITRHIDTLRASVRATLVQLN